MSEKAMPKSVSKDFGEYLKKARIDQGISRETLAKLTRIPVYHISAMEDCDHDSLPECVYVKGFIKSCSTVLDINPDEVMAAYLESRRLYLLRSRGRSSGWLKTRSMLLIILFFVCLFAVNSYVDLGKRFVNEKNTDSGAGADIDGNDAIDLSAVEGVETVKEKKMILTLIGKDRAMVKLITDGNMPEKIEVNKDTRLDFTAKRHFNLLIEDPKNVELSFNGKPYSIPGNDQVVNVFFP